MHMANHVDGGNLRLYVSSETEFFFVFFVEFPRWISSHMTQAPHIMPKIQETIDLKN